MHINVSTTITLRARGFTTTASLKDYVGRRLGFALDRFEERIQRVQVRLSDINGPRGGSDKRCQLVVQMDDLPAIVVEDTNADLYIAIDKAIGRAVHTVSRNVARHRERSRWQDEQRHGQMLQTQMLPIESPQTVEDGLARTG